MCRTGFPPDRGLIARMLLTLLLVGLLHAFNAFYFAPATKGRRRTGGPFSGHPTLQERPDRLERMSRSLGRS
ncbi:hypothetical protein [Kitasatospora sp. NPDC059571]|uniref:hypothetical protein n=1 Tax=Kitasatospora sp. NPDC059571 TaxID=3346871 RepID=UPI0036835817